ncbi:glyoxalase domain-containing protein 4-like isoform X1 [Biomphalaria glabrata]|uniref:Glyoxalase domain-containing protein 4-like isoform X1 n=2 Tax=Biomphalaria glabrata TaxID=6526 RepID=A0A9W3AZT1_BIOGL|nr:glyoxalase domain-containing protein 4-like isoform X1 [Biomphalaria glabrata]
MVTKRALHFVFKVGNRSDTVHFFRSILGMKFLRHEEFEEGCKASCNGPYFGKWSKSMVGYGPEDNHFVVELTYNYGIGSYRLGNDFLGITIHSETIVETAKNVGYPVVEEDGFYILASPDGYIFKIVNQPTQGDPVKKVSLSTSNLKKSLDYWTRLCGMQIFSKESHSVTLGYDESQCKLELIDVGENVDHATAFGRIAFSCPGDELPMIEKSMMSENQTILKPLVSLDTPGKASVQVVILADPDGHEICFVGDEAFRELSQLDPKADDLLNEAITADKSNEWFARKGKSKNSG